MAYLLYMSTLTRNVSEMVSHMQAISKVQGATLKIAEIIVAPSRITFENHEKPEFNCCGDNVDDKGDIVADNQIEIKNVEFNYPTKPDVPIVRGVSMEVKRNHIVALVGASGCGKSSIITLVERWYDPVKG
jgi:ABC-type multidrug transport system fused ATPase/permease subunit